VASDPRVDDITTGVLEVVSDIEPAEDHELIALLLRRSDWATCEDIGRQLRELARAAANHGMRLVVIAHTPDSLAIATWLRREGLQASHMVHADLDRAVTSEGVVATPAAMRVAPTGAIRLGVSHVERVSNHRRSSFVEELGLYAGTHR